MFKRSTFALWLSVASVAVAEDELSVRVVDERGKRVPMATVSDFWGFNGPLPTRNADGTESDEQWSQRFRRVIGSQMGSPSPEGAISKTDEDGRTAIALTDRVAGLAYNSQRTRGALLRLSQESDAELVLGQLTEIAITLTPASRRPESWHVRLYVPYDEDKPLANRLLGICESFSHSMTLRLPAGDYELLALGQTDYRSGIVDLRSQEARRFTIPRQSPPRLSFELELREDPKNFQTLEIESKSKGRWTRDESLLGEPAPTWHATAARGIPVDSRPSDFRGKWLLLYFWSPDCVPCVGESIPELIQFWNAHANRRNEFALVTICLDFREQMRSMAELDRRLADLRREVWKIQELPFPVVLDSSFKSIERYGLSGVGSHVLINPRGRVVKGGLSELVAVLDRDGEESDDDGLADVTAP